MAETVFGLAGMDLLWQKQIFDWQESLLKYLDLKERIAQFCGSLFN